MSTTAASTLIQTWPAQSRGAAQLVIDKYGEPDEITDTQLLWFYRGTWKRIVVSRNLLRHEFPIPHLDAVQCVVDYRVPIEKLTPVARFDGSIVVDRSAGEVSARCFDESASLLALNLMHDVVTGVRDVEQARAFRAQEFSDYRCSRQTHYMQYPRFTSPRDSTADPDARMVWDMGVPRDWRRS